MEAPSVEGNPGILSIMVKHFSLLLGVRFDVCGSPALSVNVSYYCSCGAAARST